MFPELCGVSRRWGQSHRVDSCGRGSCSNTSRAAHSRPVRSSVSSALWSSTEPRPTLITTASSGSRDKRSALSVPRVSLVPGREAMRRSVCGRRRGSCVAGLRFLGWLRYVLCDRLRVLWKVVLRVSQRRTAVFAKCHVFPPVHFSLKYALCVDCGYYRKEYNIAGSYCPHQRWRKQRAILSSS